MAFIECDGYLTGCASDIGNEVGNLLGGLLPGRHLNRPEPEKWHPCTIHIRRYKVEKLLYIANPRQLTQPAPLPHFLPVDGQDGDIVPPAREPEYAPAGWWIQENNGKMYHIKWADHGAKLANSQPVDDVAAAIHRLADEIALKPSSIPGSEVAKLAEDFTKRKQQQAGN